MAEQKNGEKKRKNVGGGIPEKTYRPVYVRPHVIVRMCRYNPSFEGFNRLPAFLKKDVIDLHAARHPDTPLPPLEISRKTRRGVVRET